MSAEIDSPAPSVSNGPSTLEVPVEGDNAYLQEKLCDAQTKFEKACQQIVLLDHRIKDLEVRYKRAVKHKRNSFRYNLRLKLSAVTGIKMMYHHYASTKADELHQLHRQRHEVVRGRSAAPSVTSSDTRDGESFV